MVDIKRFRLRFVTDRKGKKKEVIMKVKDFEELLEDLNDMAIVAERRDEVKIPHKDLVKDLKQNGIL
ncbi:MAG: hypothetical protein A2057_06875 [Ignavibacteria bacterium GWA2_35_9]|nr:MAG: hypothetical protein A2057_06875 [Ignavibacteria bacterium GWA2_35_9]OGU46080.1 MAG: hypothetical protein A2000_03805 [Ignavibacteria bacterium GWB2_36_8]OGU51782.1 MAG: hypothetical protein A2080_13640 [Ignavibacteria bacterium GWC2_36_12]